MGKSKIKITYSNKQSNKNYMHITVSRNPTYSFLCKVDDAYGISSLQSLDLVQVRSISRSKQASNIHKGKCPKKYSACRGYLWKTITERTFKNWNHGYFFVPNLKMGYFFSHNIHDEERKEIFTILRCLQASPAQVTVRLFVTLFL